MNARYVVFVKHARVIIRWAVFTSVNEGIHSLDIVDQGNNRTGKNKETPDNRERPDAIKAKEYP